MLVRFNKGPWHRKVREVDEREVARGVINIAVSSPQPMSKYITGDFSSTTLYNRKIATYRLKIVSANLRGYQETFPSIYPDGAICFEHTETI